MRKQYDLVVIGSGVAGGTIAIKCRLAGLTVALADMGPLGGTCALKGCNPKKVLVHASEVIARFEDMKGNGITGQARIDWSELMRFKRTFTESIPKNNESYYRKIGIDLYMGKASFSNEKTILVNGQLIEGRHIVVSTGARPRKLHIPGEELLCSSECFLELERLPKEIIFAGGGYIGFEFAHIAARAGAKVTILQRGSQTLKKFDPDIIRLLLEASKEIGIKIIMDQNVEKIEKSGKKMKVFTGEDKENEYTADLIVHSAGRIPNLEELNLEAANISRDKRGVLVDDFLRSRTNPLVYIAGDVNAYGIPLTPVADMEARMITNQIIKKEMGKVNYSIIPSVLFTLPSVASVGLHEDEAREKGFDFERIFKNTSQWTSTRRLGLKYSASKILIDKSSRQILGAHLIGHHVDEVINLFSLAMSHQLNVNKLHDTIFGYPTFSYDIHSLLS